jgi:hypothetical protein
MSTPLGRLVVPDVKRMSASSSPLTAQPFLALTSATTLLSTLMLLKSSEVTPAVRWAGRWLRSFHE